MGEGRRKTAVAEAGLDGVFVDDITFPAGDGYLLGATLFLPRGAKRHAVLINSATAVPPQDLQGLCRLSSLAMTWKVLRHTQPSCPAHAHRR
jgi:hypothetical protein